MRRARWFSVMLPVLVLVGCSDGTGPGDPPLECSVESVRALAVGEHRIIDPTVEGACVRLPEAGAGGAEHLYIPLATAGQETPAGVFSPYLIRSFPPATAAPPLVSSLNLSSLRRPALAQTFHDRLRARERALVQGAARPAISPGSLRVSAASPPVVGDQRTFDVCATTDCDDFVQTAATARSVGQRVAIFVDNGAPANGYTTADLDRVQTLFDQRLYPIDTEAFGRESDIDENGVVLVLLTQLVNALSPDCDSTGQVILGYFFGADLLPRGTNNPGSNEAEVFFGLVPDPNNSDCAISVEEANSHLPATFIHEFQHMINFNQHVLLRGGRSEDTWLNEGLSHFAEELGARQIPDPECPSSTSCAQEFLMGNFLNAFGYLANPEEFFLVIPEDSTGKLEERGASWLFVRWLADHFATNTPLGTDLTRALVATNQTGSVNIAARTGVDFSTLVAEWQLANYLDDLPGFVPQNPRLTYKTWNFRFAADSNQMAFPLVPDITDGVNYDQGGTLRAGSGRHVRVVQPAGSGAVDIQLTSATGAALPRSIAPRIALVRIR